VKNNLKIRKMLFIAIREVYPVSCAANLVLIEKYGWEINKAETVFLTKTNSVYIKMMRDQNGFYEKVL